MEKDIKEQNVLEPVQNPWQLEPLFYDLMKAAVTGIPVRRVPEHPDWDYIRRFAGKNSLTVLIYYGLKNSGIPIPESLEKAWKKDVLQICARQIRMDADREFLASKMEETGIDYLFIKGIEIQKLYPQTGMREMSDNDILYRLPGDDNRSQKSSTQQAMMALMKDIGAAEVSHSGVEDVFLLHGTSLFEMHREFMGPDQDHYAYFSALWDKAFLDKQSAHQYHLTLEDQYLLMLAHSYKHYSNAGCGPREIADAWLFKHQNGKDMDWSYLEKELKILNLTDYEQLISSLGSVVFEGKEASEEQRELLTWFLFNGTYGSRKQAIRKQVEKNTQKSGSPAQAKFQFIWSRLFPSPEFLKEQFPFFYRHRSLIFLLLIYRAGRGLKNGPSRIWNELKVLKSMD